MIVIFITTVMITFIIVISIYRYDVKEKIRNGCRRVVGVRQLDLQGRPFLVHIFGTSKDGMSQQSAISGSLFLSLFLLIICSLLLL